MSSPIRLFLLTVLCLTPVPGLFAQVDFDEEHIESSFPNFSRVSPNLEYFKFNGDESAIQYLLDATFEIGSSDYLGVELSLVNQNIDGSTDLVTGDFEITYIKHLYAESFQNPGFQGVSPGLRIILPTGESDYAGMFGHLVVEPAVTYSWLFKNEKFFLLNRWRLFLPIIEATESNEPPEFIRFEPRFGYENSRLWLHITFDNRYIFNFEEYVLYTRFDAGYKLKDKYGFSFFYTERIYNEVLFKRNTGLGFYYIF